MLFTIWCDSKYVTTNVKYNQSSDKRSMDLGPLLHNSGTNTETLFFFNLFSNFFPKCYLISSLRQVHWMISKWPCKPQGQRHFVIHSVHLPRKWPVAQKRLAVAWNGLMFGILGIIVVHIWGSVGVVVCNVILRSVIARHYQSWEWCMNASS